MNINQAIKRRIVQLCHYQNCASFDPLSQTDGDITLDKVGSICAELKITVADFFNSDLFRDLERN